MKPNTQYTAKGISDNNWIWTTNEEGDISGDALSRAFQHASYQVQVKILTELQSINYKLIALGQDGIHELIREYALEAKAKKKKRLTKARADRKRRDVKRTSQKSEKAGGR